MTDILIQRHEGEWVATHGRVSPGEDTGRFGPWPSREDAIDAMEFIKADDWRLLLKTETGILEVDG